MATGITCLLASGYQLSRFEKKSPPLLVGRDTALASDAGACVPSGSGRPATDSWPLRDQQPTIKKCRHHQVRGAICHGTGGCFGCVIWLRSPHLPINGMSNSFNSGPIAAYLGSIRGRAKYTACTSTRVSRIRTRQVSAVSQYAYTLVILRNPDHRRLTTQVDSIRAIDASRSLEYGNNRGCVFSN